MPHNRFFSHIKQERTLKRVYQIQYKQQEYFLMVLEIGRTIVLPDFNLHFYKVRNLISEAEQEDQLSGHPHVRPKIGVPPPPLLRLFRASFFLVTCNIFLKSTSGFARHGHFQMTIFY